jgi:hypothetical protein
MKIGILGCIDYPNFDTVQDFIGDLQLMYRPFGNLDDDYEEPITIVSRLKNDLDCTAVIAASNANFDVDKVDSIEELVEKSDQIYIFFTGNDEEVKANINDIIKSRTNFRVIFGKGRTQ